MTEPDDLDPMTLVEDAIAERGDDLPSLLALKAELDFTERTITESVMRQLALEVDDADERRELYEWHQLWRIALLHAHERFGQHLTELAVKLAR